MAGKDSGKAIADELHLYVRAVMPGAEVVPVGRLLGRNLRHPGSREGFFRYDESYLARPDAYPLDPVHLPLADQVYPASDRESGLHGVFQDSLPDGWGRIILAKRAGIHRQRFAGAHLLAALGNGGLGRLLYLEAERQRPAPDDGSINFAEIARVLAEAARHESDLDTEAAELRHLLACGSSAGGARPKVLTAKDGRHWLAKFSSIRDPHPELFVALEEAGLKLAGLAGLEVPAIERVEVGDRSLLLVERFDTTPLGGRNALVSMRSLTGAEDPFVVSYGEMARILRRFSFEPERDAEMLFRQLAVNLHLQNTDDHLQNFACLHTGEGWRLSPAYDIVPNIFQAEHILLVNGKHREVEYADLVAEGRKFGLSPRKITRLYDQVRQGLTRWREVFEECRVPMEHTRTLRASIARKWHRLARP